MSFPAPSVVAPSLSNYQWQLGNLTIGQGQGVSGWGVQYAEGLDYPPMRSGDPGRPVDTGEFVGKDLFKGRDITIQTLRFGGTSYQLGQAILNITNAFNTYLPSNGTIPPNAETESPLWTFRPGIGLVAAMVRGRKYGQRADRQLSQNKMHQPVMAFHATDPRWYGPTVATILAAPSFQRGLVFVLRFNFAFGGGTAVSEALCNNTGTWEMRPLITITGPCKVPAVANASLPGAPVVAYNVTLNVGDRLIIDMGAQSAVLVANGTSVAVSRSGSIIPGSQYWNFPPGNNLVQFSTSDSTPVAATCEVDWAPAYMSVV